MRRLLEWIVPGDALYGGLTDRHLNRLTIPGHGTYWWPVHQIH